MDTPALHLLDTILGDELLPSWHLEARRDLGIPDDCREDTLLCLTLTRRGVQMPPVAFVLGESHMDDVECAIRDFIDEAFHPSMKRTDAVAVVDYLPPVDELGSARGAARRWVMDMTNYTDVLPEVLVFARVVAGTA